MGDVSKNPLIFSHKYDVSEYGFFERSKVVEAFRFMTRESLIKLQREMRYSTLEEKYNLAIHIVVSQHSQ